MSNENFVTTKNVYDGFIANWKDRAAKRNFSAADMIVYNFIKGRPLDKGFSPIIKPQKIDSNNCDPMNGFTQAKRAIRMDYNLASYKVAPEAPKWMQPENQAKFVSDKVARNEHNYKATKQQFQDRFGIELTEELSAKLMEAVK